MVRPMQLANLVATISQVHGTDMKWPATTTRLVVILGGVIVVVFHLLFLETKWLGFFLDGEETQNTRIYDTQTAGETTFSNIVSSIAGDDKKETKSNAYTDIIHWDGVEAMDSFMRDFFKNGSSSLCQSFDRFNNANKQQQRLLLHISFSCQALYRTSGYGTGNFLTGLYGLRVTARAYQVDLLIQCHDYIEEDHDEIDIISSNDKNINKTHEEPLLALVLPHVVGFFPWNATAADSDTNNNTTSSSMNLTTSQVCQNNVNRVPVGYLLDDIKYEMRRLALATASATTLSRPIPEQSRMNYSSTKKQYVYQIRRRRESTANKKQVQLDEAVIHFRCGDLMNNNHPGFAFLRFRDYVRHIPNDIRSIGIVTQPYGSTSSSDKTTTSTNSTDDSHLQQRAIDSGPKKQERCRMIVEALESYIRQRFFSKSTSAGKNTTGMQQQHPPLPPPRVTIHSQDSIRVAYARLVLAKHTVVAISTFGVFPCLAIHDLGVCHLFRPSGARKRPNQWVLHAPAVSGDPNIDLFTVDHANILPVNTIRKLWLKGDGGKEILEWFMKDD